MSSALDLLHTLYEYSAWARDRMLDAAQWPNAAQLHTGSPGVQTLSSPDLVPCGGLGLGGQTSAGGGDEPVQVGAVHDPSGHRVSRAAAGKCGQR